MTPGQIFELYLKDLVQASLLPFDFFPPRPLVSEIDGAAIPPPLAEGRDRTRPSRARVNSVSSFLYGLGVFVKVLAQVPNLLILRSHGP